MTPLAPSLSALVRLRAERPEAVAEAAARRTRRRLIRHPGDRLMIIAADHPARGALAVGDRSLAMANRFELLERLCLALSRPGVDGVLASADVLDDLLLRPPPAHRGQPQRVAPLPVRGVLLGADLAADQDAAYGKWRDALRLPTVRGLVVGRSLLYPVDGDVTLAVDTAVSLLRPGRDGP
ncbi:hypothetical protein JHN62_36630 [Streptomyces sp. MBT54]|uniref:Cgl0159 family (beta/alpha)8-fold protein n=1 Tax=Streptomyces sp. MBT54 TaxID=1488385 RepID=UPI00190D1642|nr:hypothetical protein [Streptomyces sp. MBT54]MBK3606945.1 hypothetical protein [Streptomyces sp. MBT54]